MSTSQIVSKSEQIDLKVAGMTCSSCVATIERSLNNLEGVSATINFATESAHILAPKGYKSSVLIEAIKKSGYSATLLTDDTESFSSSRRMGWRVFFAAILALPVIVISMSMTAHHYLEPKLISALDFFALPHPLYSATGWLSIAITTPIILIIAFPIHRTALRNIAHPTMDTLISLGSLAAFSWSIYANATGAGDIYTEVAAAVIFFIVLGRFLESKAKRRAGSALANLLAIHTKEVTILRGSEEVVAPIQSLEVGDHCIVKPGDRIPTDGIVISGESSVDNSLISGESLPIDVKPGSLVIGGAINLNGRLIIQAQRVGRDTELSRITSMVLTAQTEKAPIQKTVDRISAIFVPVVLLIAIGTFAGWYFTEHSLQISIAAAVAVLVIACPCALGLATPVALLVATGRGAQQGIVLRKTSSLEIARQVNTVVFDKTGTLTVGEMQVIDLTFTANSALKISLSELLTAIHTVEADNTHPVARAITKYLLGQGVVKSSLTDYSQTSGQGAAARVKIGALDLPVLIGTPASILKATFSFPKELQDAITRAEVNGHSISVVAIDGVALAAIEVGDTIKPDAARSITALKDAAMELWLITGDHRSAAIEIANQVGIASERVISEATPEDKVLLIRKLRSEGKKVLMLGDGINDAAALVESDLSMAMGTGTDTAISSADITLLRPTLFAALDAIKLAKRTLGTIRGNLLWAFAYNAFGIPIAALGLLDPMYAGGAMAGSSLFVVLNSLRIKVRQSK